MKTWQIEMWVVGFVLLNVAVWTGGTRLELLGAGAVLLSFCHAQVGERLAEYEAYREAHDIRDAGAVVHCHSWLFRYFIGKEIFEILRASWR